MWQLIINGSPINIGDILRHRYKSGNILVIVEYEVVVIGVVDFQIKVTNTKHTNSPHIGNIQKYNLIDLTQLGFEIFI